MKVLVYADPFMGKIITRSLVI